MSNPQTTKWGPPTNLKPCAGLVYFDTKTNKYRFWYLHFCADEAVNLGEWDTEEEAAEALHDYQTNPR